MKKFQRSLVLLTATVVLGSSMVLSAAKGSGGGGGVTPPPPAPGAGGGGGAGNVGRIIAAVIGPGISGFVLVPEGSGDFRPATFQLNITATVVGLANFTALKVCRLGPLANFGLFGGAGQCAAQFGTVIVQGGAAIQVLNTVFALAQPAAGDMLGFVTGAGNPALDGNCAYGAGNCATTDLTGVGYPRDTVVMAGQFLLR